MKTLLLSPLPMEYEILLAQMQNFGWQCQRENFGPLPVFVFPELQLHFAIGGHGKTQFAVQTQYLLSRLPDTRAVICAGACGSLTPTVKVFDVVVAEKTIEHDFKLKFAKRPQPEFPGHPSLLEKTRTCKPKDFGLHVGAIASGDEDIVDEERALELRREFNVLAVAWEGAGAARACQFNRVPFLEIRGVTDSAGNEAPIDFKANLKQSLHNVALLIKHILQ